jgi:hypothetical protein
MLAKTLARRMRIRQRGAEEEVGEEVEGEGGGGEAQSQPGWGAPGMVVVVEHAGESGLAAAWSAALLTTFVGRDAVDGLVVMRSGLRGGRGRGGWEVAGCPVCEAVCGEVESWERCLVAVEEGLRKVRPDSGVGGRGAWVGAVVVEECGLWVREWGGEVFCRFLDTLVGSRVGAGGSLGCVVVQVDRGAVSRPMAARLEARATTRFHVRSDAARLADGSVRVSASACDVSPTSGKVHRSEVELGLRPGGRFEWLGERDVAAELPPSSAHSALEVARWLAAASAPGRAAGEKEGGEKRMEGDGGGGGGGGGVAAVQQAPVLVPEGWVDRPFERGAVHAVRAAGLVGVSSPQTSAEASSAAAAAPRAPLIVVEPGDVDTDDDDDGDDDADDDDLDV